MTATRVANQDSFVTTTQGDRNIVMTRLFDAPRQLVFEALTQPEHIRRWWGCLEEGYSVPVCEVDLRVGGAWRFVNRLPGGEAEFYGEYREIAPPDRLVFSEIYAPFPDAESLVTTVLTEEDGQTRMTATITYKSEEVRKMVLGTGMEQGAGLSYDRLEELVGKLQA